MTETSRRRFIGVAAGAGAAAVGVTAVLPLTSLPDHDSAPALTGPMESLAAHVSDPAAGMVTLMVGEREVVVHDRDLVARLVSAAGR